MKQYALMAGVLLSSILHAHPVLTPDSDVISIKSCEYRKTGFLDFSLLNRGFFVLKNENGTQRYYMRLGMPMINTEGYMVNFYGHYYQGINPKNSQLVNIQFPFNGLTPKATDLIELTATLDSTENKVFNTHLTSFDAEGHIHDVAILFFPSTQNSRSIEISVDGLSVHNSTINFDNQGRIKHNSQFIPFEFSINNSIQEIVLNLQETSNLAQQSTVIRMHQNGYPAGVPSNLKISRNGAMTLIYSNGVRQKMPYRIAVAQFELPEKLTQIKSYLFESNTDSGEAQIFPANGDDAFLPNYVQDKHCLPEYD